VPGVRGPEEAPLLNTSDDGEQACVRVEVAALWHFDSAHLSRNAPDRRQSLPYRIGEGLPVNRAESRPSRSSVVIVMASFRKLFRSDTAVGPDAIAFVINAETHPTIAVTALSSGRREGQSFRQRRHRTDGLLTFSNFTWPRRCGASVGGNGVVRNQKRGPLRTFCIFDPFPVEDRNLRKQKALGNQR
jgi:hypothetical protein